MKHRFQWNRIENLEPNPHICGKLLFDKGTKIIQWRKKFPTNSSGTIGYPYAKEWCGNPISYHIQMLTQMDKKNLNIRAKTTKPLEENRHKSFWHGLGSGFLDMTTKITYNPPPPNRPNGFHKNYKYSSSKHIIKKVKRQPTDWKKIIANHTSEKGFVSEMYKNNLLKNSQLSKFEHLIGFIKWFISSSI